MSDRIKLANSNYNRPSFSIGNRMLRLLWNLVYLLFFRFTPTPLFVWRNLLLRAFGAKVDFTCHVYPKAKIWAPWNLEMLAYSCLANEVICYSQDMIFLGKRAIVSQGSHLCAGSHDYTDADFKLITKPIILKDDTWVCADAFIGPGVTIGEGAVLGARGVTFKNLDAWGIYAGNPAVYIKKRLIR